MRKFWKWLSGKKTIIGTLFTTVFTFLYAKGYIDETTSIFLITISGTILSIGLGHKVYKSK